MSQKVKKELYMTCDKVSIDFDPRNPNATKISIDNSDKRQVKALRIEANIYNTSYYVWLCEDEENILYTTKHIEFSAIEEKYNL
jgi:hypothetical protein